MADGEGPAAGRGGRPVDPGGSPAGAGSPPSPPSAPAPRAVPEPSAPAAGEAGSAAGAEGHSGAGSAAVEPTPAVGMVDAAAVRRIWPEVLDAAKRRRRTTHALLMNVSVHSVDGGVLTLTISSEPLSRILAQDINTEVVRGAVRDVLGVDWRVQVRVDGGPPVGGADPGGGPPGPSGASGRSGPSGQPPEPDPRDDEPAPPEAGGATGRTDPEEAAISLLQSTLGAKRMDG